MGTRISGYILYALLSLSLLSGCITAYGPGVVGSEAPFVPVAPLDTLPSVSTGVYGVAALPTSYGEINGNRLLGMGIYQSRTQGSHRTPSRRGWSFVYGGMGYTGSFRTENTNYSYAGGLLHGASRWQLQKRDGLTLVLEPALSIYYERGGFHRYRLRTNDIPLNTFYHTRPLSGTVQFSLMLKHSLNEKWFITEGGTLSLPLSYPPYHWFLSGTVGISRQRLSLWVRPGAHLNFLTPADIWSVSSGLTYTLQKGAYQ